LDLKTSHDWANLDGIECFEKIGLEGLWDERRLLAFIGNWMFREFGDGLPLE